MPRTPVNGDTALDVAVTNSGSNNVSVFFGNVTPGPNVVVSTAVK
jgi:hypothetical protein